MTTPRLLWGSSEKIHFFNWTGKCCHNHFFFKFFETNITSYFYWRILLKAKASICNFSLPVTSLTTNFVYYWLLFCHSLVLPGWLAASLIYSPPKRKSLLVRCIVWKVTGQHWTTTYSSVESTQCTGERAIIDILKKGGEGRSRGGSQGGIH